MADEEVPETQDTVFGDKDVEKLSRRILGLQEQNARLMQEISAAGAGVDTGTARIAHFIEGLVQSGAITRAFQLREQEHWELHLRSQLQGTVAQVREMVRAAGRDARTANGLILPGANGHVPS